MSKSNKYGYSGVDIPTQAAFANVGKFDPAEINELVADNKWTQYGQLELIETQTFSGVNSVTFTNIKQNEYNVHFMTFNNCKSASGQTNNQLLQLYEAGIGFETGNVYHYANQFGSSGGTFGQNRSTSNNGLRLNGSANANNQHNQYCYLYNLGDSTKYSFMTSHSMCIYLTGQTPFMFFGSAALPQASEIEQIKYFAASSGNISGTVSLYGIKEYS